MHSFPLSGSFFQKTPPPKGPSFPFSPHPGTTGFLYYFRSFLAEHAAVADRERASLHALSMATSCRGPKPPVSKDVP